MSHFRAIVLAAMGWLAIVGVAACAQATPSRGDYDDQSLDKVAVQTYTNPHFRDGNNMCLVFTHDTAQGASMAVVC